MPTQDRLRFHDKNGLVPRARDCASHDEHGSINGRRARSLGLPPKDQELLSKEHVLGEEKSSRSEEVGDQADRGGGGAGETAGECFCASNRATQLGQPACREAFKASPDSPRPREDANL
jgi:hypothetical protein